MNMRAASAGWLTAALALIAGALIGGMLTAGPAPAAEPALTLRIAWLKAANDLTLAKAHGSLERALAPLGVSVSWAGPFPAAAPAVEALNADAADLTAGSSASFMLSRAAGAPIVLFGYQKLAPGGEAIIVPAASPVHALSDLTGRLVAVNRGGTGEYLLLRALVAADIPLDAVRRAYLSPPDASSALASGAVDAWAIWDPFLSIALAEHGARVLADGGRSGSENAVAYFAREAFAAAHRPVLVAVLAALEQENAWARQHPDAAGAVWAREMGLPDSLGPRLGENNTPPLGVVGPAERAQLERMADWYAHAGILPARPEVGPFLLDLTAVP